MIRAAGSAALIQSAFDEGAFPPPLEPLDSKSDGVAKTDEEKVAAGPSLGAAGGVMGCRRAA